MRGVRFPLSAKILSFFLLNLAFLAVAAWLFARAQLHLGLDSLLAGPANDRLQAMAEVCVAQLIERPPEEWSEVLQSTGAAYRLPLALYRHDGRRVAGHTPEPPAEVMRRILEARPRDVQRDGTRDLQRDRPPEALRDGANRPRPEGMDERERLRRDGPRNGPRPEPQPPERLPRAGEMPFQEKRPAAREGPPLQPPGPARFAKAILQTSSPARYWILIRVPLIDRAARPPMPTTLLLASDSLRGGGLLFDFTPWLIGGAVVFAFSILMWLPLVRGITRALRQMTGAAEAIADGRFDTQVAATRADELGRLGAALNHMSARLREFFTGQKRFLGDIAHELCSPLARMEMALGILDQRADEKQHAYVADVREELRHMSALVNELLSFSKAGVGGKSVELQAVPLAELAARVITRESKEGAGLVLEIPRGISVLAEPELLARALGNVIRNALRYAPPVSDGPITLSAREEGAQIIAAVTDGGPGVPADALHRLFDPFFRPESARTRETGGAGLGLAIVKSCIEACGGTVAVRNIDPRGLQVEFTLRGA